MLSLLAEQKQVVALDTLKILKKSSSNCLVPLNSLPESALLAFTATSMDILFTPNKDKQQSSSSSTAMSCCHCSQEDIIACFPNNWKIKQFEIVWVYDTGDEVMMVTKAKETQEYILNISRQIQLGEYINEKKDKLGKLFTISCKLTLELFTVLQSAKAISAVNFFKSEQSSNISFEIMGLTHKTQDAKWSSSVAEYLFIVLIQISKQSNNNEVKCTYQMTTIKNILFVQPKQSSQRILLPRFVGSKYSKLLIVTHDDIKVVIFRQERNKQTLGEFDFFERKIDMIYQMLLQKSKGDIPVETNLNLLPKALVDDLQMLFLVCELHKKASNYASRRQIGQYCFISLNKQKCSKKLELDYRDNWLSICSLPGLTEEDKEFRIKTIPTECVKMTKFVVWFTKSALKLYVLMLQHNMGGKSVIKVNFPFRDGTIDYFPLRTKHQEQYLFARLQIQQLQIEKTQVSLWKLVPQLPQSVSPTMNAKGSSVSTQKQSQQISSKLKDLQKSRQLTAARNSQECIILQEESADDSSTESPRPQKSNKVGQGKAKENLYQIQEALPVSIERMISFGLTSNDSFGVKQIEEANKFVNMSFNPKQIEASRLLAQKSAQQQGTTNANFSFNPDQINKNRMQPPKKLTVINQTQQISKKEQMKPEMKLQPKKETLKKENTKQTLQKIYKQLSVIKNRGINFFSLKKQLISLSLYTPSTKNESQINLQYFFGDILYELNTIYRQANSIRNVFQSFPTSKTQILLPCFTRCDEIRSRYYEMACRMRFIKSEMAKKLPQSASRDNRSLKSNQLNQSIQRAISQFFQEKRIKINDILLLTEQIEIKVGVKVTKEKVNRQKLQKQIIYLKNLPLQSRWTMRFAE